MRTKEDKMSRKPLLRFFNMVGAVSWVYTYNVEEPRLRRLHPVTWVWVLVFIVGVSVLEGIPRMISDLRYSWKHDTVFW